MKFNWETQSLEIEEVSYGTSRAVRLRRVGTTYLIESIWLQLMPDGTTAEEWRVVFKAAPDLRKPGSSARLEAHKCLQDVNAKILATMAEDRQRAGVPNGARARGADDRHA